MHDSFVLSSLIMEITKIEFANEGYRFGQEEDNYNFIATHGSFRLLIFQYANLTTLVIYIPSWLIDL